MKQGIYHIESNLQAFRDKCFVIVHDVMTNEQN